MKVVNLTFYPLRPQETAGFLLQRSEYCTIFAELEKHCELAHIHCYSGNVPPGETQVKWFRRKTGFFSFSYALCRHIRALKPGIVFLHSFNEPVQWLWLKLFMPQSTRLVIQHHAEKPYVHPLKSFLQRLAFRDADLCFFTSVELAADFFKRGIITETCKVKELMEVSTFFGKTDKFSARTQLKLFSAQTFLWVGRLNNNKDPLTVLNAFDILRKSSDLPHVLYMLYGSVELEEELKQFVKENTLEECVYLIGGRPHEELALWFSAADYYISASHYEGSGVALCEAMACGCVPIVTNIPSFKTMTRNGACGFLYPPGDSDRLAAILEEAIKTNAREKLSEKALQIFREDLSYEAISKKLFEEVTRLMARPS